MEDFIFQEEKGKVKQIDKRSKIVYINFLEWKKQNFHSFNAFDSTTLKRLKRQVEKK